MTSGELTQFVAFRSNLPVDTFTTTWRPVAAGFLARGAGTITLAASCEDGPDGDGGTNLLSRNTWPAAAYHRTFPDGLAADADAGAITVRQAGVFAVHPGGGSPIPAARPDRDLSVVLVRLADPAQADATVEALRDAVQAPDRQVVAYRGVHPAQRYHLAVTVHGAPGSGVETSAALRSAARARDAGISGSDVLTGRELLSLVP